jgi:large subunit ribosomal protein L5e
VSFCFANFNSRYQVKYKRRRAGKTDYYARKRLVTQARNKYNAPKYRLVVRFTNKDMVCQIVTSEIVGDKVFASAYAHELKRYGVKHDLCNWAAAYCTRLLVARRALADVEEADGEFNMTEDAEIDGESRRPFKVYFDVGLTKTSTGARVFFTEGLASCLRRAAYGGLPPPDVPEAVTRDDHLVNWGPELYYNNRPEREDI